MTIGSPAFCLAIYLTGVHFRGELQYVGGVSNEKIKCQTIKTRVICGVRLLEELYADFCAREHVFWPKQH